MSTLMVASAVIELLERRDRHGRVGGRNSEFSEFLCFSEFLFVCLCLFTRFRQTPIQYVKMDALRKIESIQNICSLFSKYFRTHVNNECEIPLDL